MKLFDILKRIPVFRSYVTKIEFAGDHRAVADLNVPPGVKLLAFFTLPNVYEQDIRYTPDGLEILTRLGPGMVWAGPIVLGVGLWVLVLAGIAIAMRGLDVVPDFLGFYAFAIMFVVLMNISGALNHRLFCNAIVRSARSGRSE